MYSKVNSVALKGIDGYLVHVETDVSSGLPDFSMVGFLSSEVKEARERVRTALRNSDFQLMPRKITVNLSPANVRKEGTAYDLAMAISLLVGFGFIPAESTEGIVMIGELSLDGKVCPINGVLSRVGTARQAGFRACFVPWENRLEGAVVSGIRVIGVHNLREAVHLLHRPEEQKAEECPSERLLREAAVQDDVDFSEVHGQKTMKRAAEIAAAGMHNLLFVGSPGSGKSMIARRIPTILPRMSLEESLAVSRVYSVAGLLPPEQPLILRRPFRSPHHTISTPALVGGGRIPRPGEISLADRGVLFLDELPEFQKTVLEVLRQPMEDREVIISRVHGACRFPADTMVVAAMNPCRCGFYPDRKRCRCSEMEARRYLQRISRPLLDRMDLCVEAPPVSYQDMHQKNREENSQTIRRRVEHAHYIQKKRFQNSGIFFNSQMNVVHLQQFCSLGSEEDHLLEKLYEQNKLSVRGYHRILKVARTIADLDDSPGIRSSHLMEAAGYRSLEMRFWG
ncbi:MAG: YifB family Mg chelatase-like AAA ATPase [Clostridiales bacterium]|nr:YifB family Mg chelatase-like AAA ATPase [Clostridiales bacterium]